MADFMGHPRRYPAATLSAPAPSRDCRRWKQLDFLTDLQEIAARPRLSADHTRLPVDGLRNRMAQAVRFCIYRRRTPLTCKASVSVQ